MLTLDEQAGQIKRLFEAKRVKINTMKTYITSYRRIIKNVFGNQPRTAETLAKPHNRRKVADYVKSKAVAVNSKPVLIAGWLRCLEVQGVDVSKSPLNLLYQKMTAYAQFVKDNPDKVSSKAPNPAVFK
jgi:hypothetical protein